MHKLEYDTINGVYEVEDISADVRGLSAHKAGDMDDVRAHLRVDFYGVRGMLVDDAIYATIDAEYGIKRLAR